MLPTGGHSAETMTLNAPFAAGGGIDAGARGN